MIGGPSLRLTMVNLRYTARQASAFATPVRSYFLKPSPTTKLQSHAGFITRELNYVRTVHTSVIRQTENSIKDDAAHQEIETKLTLRERLKIVVQEYGTTAVVFHVCISLSSLGLCYAAVKSGIDVQAALQNIGVNPKVSESMVATEASTFVVAYACHKVFAPLRMLMTITCTPLIVRKLRRMGVMKEPVKQET